MRRHLFRRFVQFHNPLYIHRLYTPHFRLQLNNSTPEVTKHSEEPKDSYQIFQQFFNQNGVKSQAQYNFFKQNYPQKMTKKKNPHEILKLSQNATEEEIKNAYRNLAIQKHPKNNNSPNAEAQFQELGKAYEECISCLKESKLSELGITNFLDNFDKLIGESKRNHSQNNQNQNEFYSEYSQQQISNGRRNKFIMEKTSRQNGKLLKVKREENLEQNGQKEIIQTIDDGTQVKRKKYVQNSEKKKLQ